MINLTRVAGVCLRLAHAQSLTVVKNFGVNTKSAKASAWGEKRHSVQKSSYYSLVSTVLLAIICGGEWHSQRVMSRVH